MKLEHGTWYMGHGKKLFLSMFYVLCSMLLSVSAAYAFDPCDQDAEYIPIGKRYEKGLIFEISKCGIDDSHILGTIHTDSPEVIDEINYAFDLIARGDSASFETKFFGKDVDEQLDVSFYPHGSVETLADTVGAEYYDKYVRILQRDYPEFSENTFYRMRPWAAALITQYPEKTGSGKVMDEQLQEFALSRDIEVQGIEKGKELISFFSEMKEEDALEFFRYSVDHHDEQKNEMGKLTDAYLKKDLKEINSIAEEAMDEMERTGVLKGFRDKLIIKRNKKMAARITPHIKRGNAFVAVGALHLLGKEGVLSLLEKKGYYINVAKTPDELFEESLR